MDKHDVWQEEYRPKLPYVLDGGADEPQTWIDEEHDPEALRTLLNFCVNNKDLDELEGMISAFNPLKILGVSDMEVRHSNVLAWLIDPNAHHGLGYALFKNIVLEVLKDSRVKQLPEIEAVISADYSDLRIQREWNNIDVFAYSPKNKLLAVIENKVNAEESEQQLAKYAGIVDRKYPDYKKVFIFLSLDGTPPKGSDRYNIFTHAQVYEIVRSVVEVRKDFINSKVYDFIWQYLNVLEDKTMSNTKLIELCGKLYREHGKAIQTIMKYGIPKLPPDKMGSFHSRTDTESVHSVKDTVNTYYTFIPKAWSGKVPENNLYSSDKYLVFFDWKFDEYENHKITLRLIVGNFPDQKERNEFMQLVSKAAKESDCGLKVRSSKTNTTLYSVAVPLKTDSGEDLDLDSYDAVTELMVSTYKSPEVQKALAAIDGIVQSFAFKAFAGA